MKTHGNARTTFKGRVRMVERVQAGDKPADVAREMGVSASTVCKWVRRLEAEGPEGLKDRSSKPRRSPRRTSDALAQAMAHLRSRKLTATGIALALGAPISTVAAVLHRLGLGRLADLEPKEPPRRYERSRPGELVHLDIKKLGKIGGIGHRIHGDRSKRARGVGHEYLHVCIDDHTRLAYAEILPDERAGSVLAFLQRAAAWLAERGVRIERILTDNGGAYRANLFRDLCASLGVAHKFTRPYRPQTNGKAERFIQTITRGWAYGRPYPSSAERTAALDPWLHHYNCHRPHASLGMRPPMARLAESVNNLSGTHS